MNKRDAPRRSPVIIMLAAVISLSMLAVGYVLRGQSLSQWAWRNLRTSRSRS